MTTAEAIEQSTAHAQAVRDYLAGQSTAERVRVRLWLSWLDDPWDKVRRHLLDLMDEWHMSHEDLSNELFRAGYRVSHVTVGTWLGGRAKKAPPLEALQAMAAVFARVIVGEWIKGQPGMPFAS